MLSSHKKKRELSLSFAFCAPLNTHTHIKDHHGAFCDDDDDDDVDDAIVVLFIVFVFDAFISLSLSLLSRVIDWMFLHVGEESQRTFSSASSPSIFKNVTCDVFCVCVFVSRKKDKTARVYVCVRVCVYIY